MNIEHPTLSMQGRKRSNTAMPTWSMILFRQRALPSDLNPICWQERVLRDVERT